jgi:hypothetical protein
LACARTDVAENHEKIDQPAVTFIDMSLTA